MTLVNNRQVRFRQGRLIVQCKNDSSLRPNCCVDTIQSVMLRILVLIGAVSIDTIKINYLNN
jgi:hypothetical protein